MSNSIESLLERIEQLKIELENEFEARRRDFKFRFEKRRIVFEEEMTNRQRELKTSIWRYIKGARPLIVLTAPMIYSIIIPLLLLDIFVTVYQAVCFPVYKIRKARRRDFIVFDRQQLGYLNGIEKLNCIYCSYANGLIGYVREISSRTEQYWCPIKHARSIQGMHDRYLAFTEFGDAAAYRNNLETLRKRLNDEEQKDFAP